LQGIGGGLPLNCGGGRAPAGGGRRLGRNQLGHDVRQRGVGDAQPRARGVDRARVAIQRADLRVLVHGRRCTAGIVARGVQAAARRDLLAELGQTLRDLAQVLRDVSILARERDAHGESGYLTMSNRV
jgi:hypothetical protein